MTDASFFSVAHQKRGKTQFQPQAGETPVANSFSGFKPDAFVFFEELSQNNNKAWFDQNRARYEEHVTGTFRGLLETLTPFILALNPHFEVSGRPTAVFRGSTGTFDSVRTRVPTSQTTISTLTTVVTSVIMAGAST